MANRCVVSLLAALSLAGCVSPCLEIQRTLCTCRGATQNERSACEDAAAAQENLAPPDEAQLAVCEQLRPGCEALVKDSCDKLQTPEGRVTCGISEVP